MCVTCGCGGKKATVEELDQTKTHEHPHAEDGHVHRDSDQHRHPVSYTHLTLPTKA